jgi:hypothetical protein
MGGGQNLGKSRYVLYGRPLKVGEQIILPNLSELFFNKWGKISLNGKPMMFSLNTTKPRLILPS